MRCLQLIDDHTADGLIRMWLPGPVFEQGGHGMNVFKQMLAWLVTIGEGRAMAREQPTHLGERFG